MSKQELLNEYASYCFDVKQYNEMPISFEKFCEWLKKTLDNFNIK
jgi:hypothetical protein